MITWKLGLPKKKFRHADVIVISVSKSGRTWLRVFVNKYFSLRYKVPFELSNMGRHDERFPFVSYTHELWSHRTDSTPREYLAGTFVLPGWFLRQKKIVLLYRDPRDLMVSLYFQTTKRSRRTRDALACTLSEFIRHRRFGIENVIRVMNHWRRRFRSYRNCKWVCYETMHQSPREVFTDILEFMGENDIDHGLLDEALEFASFKNMKRMEKNGEFGKTLLQPTDPHDPDTYKVREGKVGSYINYFVEDDIRYLEQKIERLDSFFGY